MKKSRHRKSIRKLKQKKVKDKYRTKIGPVLMAVGVIALLISFFYQTQNQEFPANGNGGAIIVPEDEFYHVHTDFAVYINGRKMDFDSSIYSERDPRIHLHIRNQYGDSVIHVEARDVNLGDFFDSLGMKLTENCFRTRSVNFCNDGSRTLKMYVNGIRNNDFGNYEIKDLDRILITFGNEAEEEIKKQMDSVTRVSCISSNKCITPQDILKL
jgi:hypothetical protein